MFKFVVLAGLSFSANAAFAPRRISIQNGRIQRRGQDVLRAVHVGENLTTTDAWIQRELDEMVEKDKELINLDHAIAAVEQLSQQESSKEVPVLEVSDSEPSMMDTSARTTALFATPYASHDAAFEKLQLKADALVEECKSRDETHPSHVTVSASQSGALVALGIAVAATTFVDPAVVKELIQSIDLSAIDFSSLQHIDLSAVDFSSLNIEGLSADFLQYMGHIRDLVLAQTSSLPDMEGMKEDLINKFQAREQFVLHHWSVQMLGMKHGFGNFAKELQTGHFSSFGMEAMKRDIANSMQGVANGIEEALRPLASNFGTMKQDLLSKAHQLPQLSAISTVALKDDITSRLHDTLHPEAMMFSIQEMKEDILGRAQEVQEVVRSSSLHMEQVREELLAKASAVNLPQLSAADMDEIKDRVLKQFNWKNLQLPVASAELERMKDNVVGHFQEMQKLANSWSVDGFKDEFLSSLNFPPPATLDNLNHGLMRQAQAMKDGLLSTVKDLPSFDLEGMKAELIDNTKNIQDAISAKLSSVEAPPYVFEMPSFDLEGINAQWLDNTKDVQDAIIAKLLSVEAPRFVFETPSFDMDGMTADFFDNTKNIQDATSAKLPFVLETPSSYMEAMKADLLDHTKNIQDVISTKLPAVDVHVATPPSVLEALNKDNLATTASNVNLASEQIPKVGGGNKLDLSGFGGSAEQIQAFIITP